MEEASDLLAEKVQALSDIELAVLICLVADQHCIIETEKELLDGLDQELRLIASNVFGLTCAVLDCDEHTTLDDFGSGILVRNEGDDYFSSKDGRVKNGGYFGYFDSVKMPERRASKSPKPFTPLEGSKIANVVVAKNLNRASEQVQIQALELMRGKRNFTRTAVYPAPKTFLFVALNASGSARLTGHLNDQFFISHKHADEDGFQNIEELQEKEAILEDDASMSSVVRSPPDQPQKRSSSSLVFSSGELDQLSTLMADVNISSEVRAYLHNIVVFMRLHRAVAGGISAMATHHFDVLAHALAPLHGLSYITPSLVALAARKIYPHRIAITAPENERSLQWGSSLDAVKAILEGVTVEDVLEEVLQSVEAPL